MKWFQWALVLLPSFSWALDPLTSGFSSQAVSIKGLGFGAAIFSSVLWNSKDAIVCRFKECCGEPYVRTNLIGLRESLNENVFGQHIVHDIVIRSLKSHLGNNEPKKALTLSFHGMTGSGKNYVSQFIAESIYEAGLQSKFAHLFISTLHFPNHSQADQYKADLQSWVKGNVSACARSLFIFDEIDKLAPGVIDGLKPFLDYHNNVDGVDFRKSIFIFLSNTGGTDISKFVYDHWKTGKQREELTFQEMENSLNLAAFNELGGLQKTNLIEHALIDHTIPFLPLEKQHVKMCVRRQMEKKVERLMEERLEDEDKDTEVRPIKTFTEEDIDAIVERKSFWPSSHKIFSESGCKKIDRLVDMFFDEDEV